MESGLSVLSHWALAGNSGARTPSDSSVCGAASSAVIVLPLPSQRAAINAIVSIASAKNKRLKRRKKVDCTEILLLGATGASTDCYPRRSRIISLWLHGGPPERILLSVIRHW